MKVKLYYLRIYLKQKSNTESTEETPRPPDEVFEAELGNSVSKSVKNSAKPAQFISEEMSTPESSDDEVTRATNDNIVECQTTPESSEDEGIQLNEDIAQNDKDTTDENVTKTGTTNDTEDTVNNSQRNPNRGKR